MGAQCTPAACSPCAAADACCCGGAACCEAAAASACWAALAREVSIAPQSVGAVPAAPASAPAGPCGAAPEGRTKSGGGGGSSSSISVSSSCKRVRVRKKCRRTWHSSPKHLAKCQQAKCQKEAEGRCDLAVPNRSAGAPLAPLQSLRTTCVLPCVASHCAQAAGLLLHADMPSNIDHHLAQFGRDHPKLF